MKRSIAMLVVLILILYNPLQLSAQKKEKEIPAIEKAELEYWVNHISSDSMRGRKNGNPEMKIVAQWIADEFKKAGLKAFPDYDGYFQHYYIKRSKDSIPESNVIGYIEGSDPKLKHEFIVISAHFDHIGVGRPVQGDSIYNGANDNASGTCAVIGVAKTLKMMKIKPARSIVFAAFSGEEMGMRGSRYFTGHAPFSIASVYLDVNFEMLGHCKILGENKYMITGPAMTNLKNILNDYNKDKEWKLVDTVKNLANLFFASDNAAFANLKRIDKISYGVPAHTFVIHNGEDHVHKPNDEAKYFNFGNYRNFIQYMSGLTAYLSENKTLIDWINPGFKRIGK